MIKGVMIMKIFAEKAAKTVKLAILAAAVMFCTFDTAAAAEAVYGSVLRCLNVVIPSLFAMMIVSALIVRSGALTVMPRWCGRISRFVFGMEGNIFPIFTFGMFAGYPVGVKMLCEEYTAGRISKKRAELLAGLCFGAGPAFTFGCISHQLYSSDKAGKAILISNISANFILALIMSIFLRKDAEESFKGRKFSLSSEMLTDSVVHSGRAMGDICIMITAFSVVNSLLIRIGTAAAVGELLAKLTCLDRRSGEALVAALLDITNVSALSCGDWLLLPYISALVSFGGICVMFQLSAVSAGRISLRPLIIMRIAAAFMSFWICRMILPYFMEYETVEVSASAVCRNSGGSPVSSVMLVLMTVMLMCEMSGKSNKKPAEST